MRWETDPNVDIDEDELAAYIASSSSSDDSSDEGEGEGDGDGKGDKAAGAGDGTGSKKKKGSGTPQLKKKKRDKFLGLLSSLDDADEAEAEQLPTDGFEVKFNAGLGEDHFVKRKREREAREKETVCCVAPASCGMRQSLTPPRSCVAGL